MNDHDDLTDLRHTIEDQTRYIEVLLARLEFVSAQEVDLRQMLGTLRDQVTRADTELRRNEAHIAQLNATIQSRDTTIQTRDTTIATLEAQAREREATITYLQSELGQFDRRSVRVTTEVVNRLSDAYRQVAPHLPGRRR